MFWGGKEVARHQFVGGTTKTSNESIQRTVIETCFPLRPPLSTKPERTHAHTHTLGHSPLPLVWQHVVLLGSMNLCDMFGLSLIHVALTTMLLGWLLPAML